MLRISRLALLCLAHCAPASAQQGTAFAAQQSPSPPDYAQPESWAAGSTGPGPSRLLPRGSTPAATFPAVDVFYVHPTTYLSRTQWNQDIADSTVNAWTDSSVIARQASVFSSCCRVFAPRYRQASSLNFNGERRLSLELAYGDVERAFEQFLHDIGPGRPFIIAGHSQGSYLAAELITRKIDDTSLRARLVAAYLIGMNLTEGDFTRRFEHIPPCDTPRQTGCIVVWNAVLAGTDLIATAARYEKSFPDPYDTGSAKRLLCINPLTFDRRKVAAPARASRGAVPGEPGEGPLRPLIRGSVSARCEEGLLVVQPSATLALKPLSYGGMHYHDYGLFYADIRANAARRARAFDR
jgi:pimeloyl-ACP methyl ester carboxylesterase